VPRTSSECCIQYAIYNCQEHFFAGGDAKCEPSWLLLGDGPAAAVVEAQILTSRVRTLRFTPRLAFVSDRGRLWYGGSEGFVLGTRDDFVLQGAGQIAEVVAVPGNSDDQIAVFFGFRLRST